MSSSSGYPRTRILFGSINVIAVRHSAGDAVSLPGAVPSAVRLVTFFRVAFLAAVARGGRRCVARRLGIAFSCGNEEATIHDWVFAP